MPNQQIDPSLSSALQQAFNKPQDSQQSSGGLWQALVNAVKPQPGIPQQQPSPYSNLANKATGLPYK